MYIELREKDAKYYVIIRHEDSKEKGVAQFASSVKAEAYNVARQYAKQNKCMIQYTTGNKETPEFPNDGPEEAL